MAGGRGLAPAGWVWIAVLNISPRLLMVAVRASILAEVGSWLDVGSGVVGFEGVGPCESVVDDVPMSTKLMASYVTDRS